MKTCFKCGIPQPLENFYRHPQMKDGTLNKCKDCTKKDSMERRAIMLLDPNWVMKERARCRLKADRYRKPQTAEQNRIRTLKYNQKYPEREAAHIAAGNAFRRGKLTKPDRCSACGIPAIRLDKHHDDYQRPLDVRWLCLACHGKTRRKAA